MQKSRALNKTGVRGLRGWQTLMNRNLSAPLARMSFAPLENGPRGDVMVVVFLRGAADGLNIVVPHADDNYYHARPTLAVARPDDRRVTPGDRVQDLDGFFGLHPAMRSLRDAWQQGDLALIHACGSPEDSHSHFRAMEYMERGVLVPDDMRSSEAIYSDGVTVSIEVVAPQTARAEHPVL